jgi:hypothetical protein
MAQTTATTKTRTIAGHRLTLTAGIRYRAERPFAARGRTSYPVTIRNISAPPMGVVAEWLMTEPLTYDDANRLVNAFNNGVTSFDGRLW